MNEQEKPIVETVSQFARKSVTLKLISIFILMLLLMIPVAFIQSMINERQELRSTAVQEVSDKWANEQHLYGPILTLPLINKVNEDGQLNENRSYAHILPAALKMEGSINPKSLTRGIYEVVVYDSRVSINGSFSEISKYTSELKDFDILWNEAFLTINISDLRGIKEKPAAMWNGLKTEVEPGSKIPEISASGLTINNIFENAPESDSFNLTIDLYVQGSSHLGFMPLGKENKIKLNSDWSDPSFSGAFLPDTRNVTDDGFTAEYTILEMNRNYPQFWIGNQYTAGMEKSIFGVDLLLPMTDYQKSMRSTKYALLAISLTFLTFFLIEIFNKKKVHPFQYILIGFALTLFYTLLVSISEHLNFNAAYLISSVSIIAMIGLYAKTIFSNSKQTILLVLILCLTYSFVYVTLQIQDYALIIGSIGLTLILALTMYITRNINWYELGASRKSAD